MEEYRNDFFETKFPLWKCPECGNENRYADTFGEICLQCRNDHTLDWQNYIIDPDIKLQWAQQAAVEGNCDILLLP